MPRHFAREYEYRRLRARRQASVASPDWLRLLPLLRQRDVGSEAATARTARPALR